MITLMALCKTAIPQKIYIGYSFIDDIFHRKSKSRSSKEQALGQNKQAIPDHWTLLTYQNLREVTL